QILALLGGEGLSRATHAGHAIQLVLRASSRGGTHECTLSGRTEPNGAGGTPAASERRQTRGAQAQARADSVGGGRRRRRCGDCEKRWGRQVPRLPNKAPLRAPP